MAPPKSNLTVIRSPSAVAELHAIWQWNAERYGLDHADDYLRFIEQRIDRLSYDHAQGGVVHERADLRYITVRRRTRGHGHVIVYRCDDRRVVIAHIFHSAQDWVGKLAEGPGQPD